MGDLNIDEMKSSSFKTMIEVCSFTQLISKPTHVTRCSSTLMNHIYVNHPISYISRGVIPNGLSDHHLVYTTRKMFKGDPQNHHIYIKYRDQKKFIEYDFKRDLTS